MDSGAIISENVISDKHKPLSLFQGGLEIPMKVFVRLSDEKSMTILKEKIKTVNYPCDMDYVNGSKKFLKYLLGESMEEDEKEAEVGETSECGREYGGLSKDII